MKTTTITKDFLCTLPFQFLQYWIWYVRSLMFLNRRIWIGTTFITLGVHQRRFIILIVHFNIHWLDEYFQRFPNSGLIISLKYIARIFGMKYMFNKTRHFQIANYVIFFAIGWLGHNIFVLCMYYSSVTFSQSSLD